ncbi:MAG: hypothetical protein U9Q06_00930 [Nanoarchaeota archaeon]|nr:hypothetical protein [Nanoarchaeota archaeon]
MVKLVPRKIQEANWPEAYLQTEEETKKYLRAVDELSLERAKDVLKRESNLFRVLFSNQIGIPTATIPELDLMWNTPEGRKILRGHYEDSREVCLRSADDSYSPNKPLAKKLAEEISYKKFKNPFILKGLEIQEDEGSKQYGLTLIPGDNFEIIEAPDFSAGNNQRQFISVNPDYSINWCEQGESGRTFYAKEGGILRVYLGRDGDLVSCWYDLGGSYCDGGVVSVRAEGTRAADLEDYVRDSKERAEKAYQQRLKILNSRREKALALLEGKE